MAQMGMRDFLRRYDTEEKCRTHLEQIVWSGGRYCPHCGSINTIAAKDMDGVYRCRERECRKQFTVTTKTIFHSTKLPLTTWFAAIYLMCQSSKGIAAAKVSEWCDLPYKTAWHLCHRIRAMMTEAGNEILTGIVELDEVYVGGKPRFTRDENGVVVKHKTGRGTDKQGVFVAVQRGGKVRAALIDGHGVADIQPHANRWVDRDAQLMTDELPAYNRIGRDYRFHHKVFHKDKEYAREGGIHVNTAESFNSTIKRAVVGVFHYVSKKHMVRYIDEAVFRWNTRTVGIEGRMARLIQTGLGRRLPYAYLTAN